jgi:hypothetical protein
VWPRSRQQTRPEGALMQPCSAPSGGDDPVQRPSPAAEVWSDTCGKRHSQEDDQVSWRAAARGEKTGDAWWTR